MKFRNYCIVIMGETEGALSEIVKISETKPNVLDAKGIVIATFSSVGEPKELTDFFKSYNRNFFLFDLNSENSGFNIVKEEINEGLFGFLKKMGDESLKEKTDKLMMEITSTTKTRKVKKINQNKESEDMILVSIEDIEKMTPKDKNDLMNKLIDKGVNNLSDYDKKILNKLALE